MEEPKTKVCSKCGRELPITKFALSKTSKDGHVGKCRDCVNAYQRERYALKKGKTMAHANPSPALLNPKFSDKTPRELQQDMRELKEELIARGFNVEVKCAILQEIII